MAPMRVVCSILASLFLLSCATPDEPGPVLSPTLIDAGDEGALVAADALAFEAAVATFGPELAADLAFLRAQVGTTDVTHVRYQQTIEGVPVHGGDAIVHLSPTGAVAGVTDALVRDLSVDTTPAWTAEEAIDLAVAAADLGWADLSDPPLAELWVLRQDNTDHLVWRVQLRRLDGSEHTSMPLLFLDAHSGEVVWSYDNLRSATGTSNYSGTVTFETYFTGGNYYLEDTTRDIGTYSFYNTTTSIYYLTDPDDSWTSASQREGVDAHYAGAETLDWFAASFGRAGLDGSGGPGYIGSLDGGPAVISLLVNYGNNYANAFFGDPYFIFGDGNGVSFDPLTTVDIVAHEMSHAVTTADIGLIYNGQSGAIDESYSDVYGAMVERHAYGESADTWLLGEDCYTPSVSGDALRYMADPTADGSSRDHYDDRYTGFSDNGGVHLNSGIGNLAFYLMAEGGSHPTYGGSMTGIGPDAAVAIWYEGMSYLTASSDFAAARSAHLSGATDLYGASSAEYAAVENAWSMVGVGSPAPAGDLDGDGYDSIADGGTDCDDTNAAVNPGAIEVCNGIDDDCDGTTDVGAADETTWYTDADADGAGDPASSTAACSAPSGHVADSSDCDDTNAAVHPGATEMCNGIDDDCDGSVDVGAADASTWHPDVDADGFGDPASATQACSAPSGQVADGSDCDDTNAAVFPGAAEVCNGVDDDCDGTVDQGASDASTWYADSDSDGYGDPSTSTSACSAPAGHVADSTDCNDAAAAVNPGASEICNGLDDDCDGTTDVGAIDTSTWYADSDSDGYGDPGTTTSACSAPAGHVADGSDCNDTDPAVSPAAPELRNGVDDDCDGATDVGALDAVTYYDDLDGDTYGAAASGTSSCSQPAGTVADGTDCDDTNAAVNPAAAEVCNGLDDDCDGTTDLGATDASTFYADADSDGYGDATSATAACSAPTGHVADATDCDDTNAAVNPGAIEVCNGLDDDCDGTTDVGAAEELTWYTDADADGYGDASSTTLSCAQPTGTVLDGSDCDDTSAAVNPGATEVCNGLDDDCDGSTDLGAADAGTWYTDADADTFGDAASSTTSCTQPSGTVADGSDCDDTNAAVNPGATEVCNGLDDDCDGSADTGAVDAGTWYADADADSYGDATSSTAACSAPTGHVADASDCNDTDAAVNPGATEVCNGLDDDCDGTTDLGAADESTWYADTDGDGYGDPASSTASCSAPSGHVADATDCDDTDAGINPGATEVADGLDNDCNGLVDDGISTSTCEGYAASYSGTLTGTGDSDVQPGGSWYYSSSSGTHSACLSGPSSADFDLYLYRWTPRGWRSVASSTGATSDETIAFSGGRGYYAWVVASASGSGDYTLALTTP